MSPPKNDSQLHQTIERLVSEEHGLWSRASAEAVSWLYGAAQESNLPRRGLHARTGFEDRRRSRTYRGVGCTPAPVLKTGWATGPVPLRGQPSV